MTINDIIAFISKAEAEKATINVEIDSIIIIFGSDENKYCDIILNKDDNKLHVRNNRGQFEVNLSEADMHLYEVLLDTLKVYSENNAVEEFKNFFNTKEEDSKATINDLDDEE